jgi:S1-C subfamily serine protease
VVRVVVPDGTGVSFGSGALVAVRQNQGLVITNWHVVREAAGQIVVVFPGGFRSGATVLKTDRDWDLAALAVWRPPVDPIRLANRPPRPGEPLAIAGYGSGRYRTVTGRCTQYVAPGLNQPFEMVELSAAAREGDSGGPILNDRGELAGVLFGAASGQTTGSYCGRVRSFLASVTNPEDLAPTPTMIAERRPGRPHSPVGPARSAQAVAGQRPRPAPSVVARRSRPATAEPATAHPPMSKAPVVSIRAAPGGGPAPAESSAAAAHAQRASHPEPQSQTPSPNASEPLQWEDIAGKTLGEQVKTVLAGIGLLAILLHGLALLTKQADAADEDEE